MTGLTVTFVRESPTPVLDLVEEDEPLALLDPAGRPKTVASPSRAASKWACRTTSRAAGRCWRIGSRSGEVEGGLGAGEVAEGSGAAGVERRVGAEGLQARGAVGERAVEVEGVGDVELGLEPHRAGVVHVVVVEGGVARVDVEVAVLRIRSRVDVGEVVPLDRLGDEPVQLRRTDPTGDGGDLGVDEPGGLDASAPGSCGWWPRRPRGPATPGPVRRGPAPTAAGGGGAARGRGRRASSPRSSRSRGRCRARRGRTPRRAAHPHRRWAPRARNRAR